MSTPATKKKNKARGGMRNASMEPTANLKYRLSKPKAKGNEDQNLMRKSLFDYVRAQMMQRGIVLFMQRVFIFVKNLPNAEIVDISLPPSVEDDDEGEHQEAEEDYEYMPRLSARHTKKVEQIKLQNLSGKILEVTLRQLLEKIIKFSNRASISEDKLTGLFLYMGKYSLIVLEGNEDAIGIFCDEFNKSFSEFWADNKVFLVEDKISKNFFDCFVYKSVPPKHINQKFPPKHAEDEIIMAEQHEAIKQKLHSLCESFQLDYEEEEEEEASYQDNENEDHNQDELLGSLAKHVPEVQRIELVLQCRRFYRNIAEFAKTFHIVPMSPEDEDICWPARNNYTPYGVYEHSEFDYNLTYPESNATSEEKALRLSDLTVDFDSLDSDKAEVAEDAAAGDGALGTKSAPLSAVPSAAEKPNEEGA